MSVRADLTSEAFRRDPAAELARLRAEAPVVRTRFPIIGEVWLSTTYEATRRVLKDSDSFGLRRAGRVAGLRWWMPPVIRTLADNMLTIDEPDHTRLRSIVDDAFRRRAVSEMEPAIRAIAERHADRLFDQGQPADLVAAYARPLPLDVISDLLGIGAIDRAAFVARAERITDIRGPVGFLRLMPALIALRRMVAATIARTRAGGGDGLIAELVRAEESGAPISRDEIVAMVFLLLFAGHETTTHLISGAVFELLKDPSRRDWLLADDSNLQNGIEEFLRYLSVVQVSKPRFVRRDTEIEGVSLARGDRIMALIAAANHDPTANDDPATLDLARRPIRHVAFGSGIHFCLGHQLARLEAKCALEALFARWPGLGLAIDPAELRWRARPGLRALEALPVTPGAGSG